MSVSGGRGVGDALQRGRWTGDTSDGTNLQVRARSIQYRRCITRVIEFIRQEYPHRATSLIVELTQEQRANQLLYPGSTHDLRYDRINPAVMKHFIRKIIRDYGSYTASQTRQYPSYSNIRKFHDAILKCSNVAGLQLSANYKHEMKEYMIRVKWWIAALRSTRGYAQYMVFNL